jgi:hypothetical protein
VPPPDSHLQAETERAVNTWIAARVGGHPWIKARTGEVDGLAAIMASQFPDVKAGTLGRVNASAAMALNAIRFASDLADKPLTKEDLILYLGFAGAKLVADGREIAAMEQEGNR